MAATETGIPASTPARWTGRVLSTLLILFLLFDSIPKILGAESAMRGTVQLGYPGGAVFWIGLVVLIATILYAIPRTAVLGAIILTGHLGGATASMVRIWSPWFVFPVVIGVLLWIALCLRNDRLRSLLTSGS